MRALAKLTDAQFHYRRPMSASRGRDSRCANDPPAPTLVMSDGARQRANLFLPQEMGGEAAHLPQNIEVGAFSTGA